MSNILGPAFINFAAGFSIAAMLAILGVPTLALLVLQLALVVAAGVVLLVSRRRDRRASARQP
jgi:Flp pilus assembly protein TadB